MISMTFSGDSFEEVAALVRRFAETTSTLGVLPRELASDIAMEETPRMESIDEIAMRIRRGKNEEPWGYRPSGVGLPYFYPVDDGTEWDEVPLEDWIRSCTYDGEVVVGVLASKHIIDPRKEFKQLDWHHNKWSGTWTGPRKQARRIMDDRNLTSWPYGHTYVEPRRLWMHPDIAKRVLRILENLRQERLSVRNHPPAR